MPIWYPSAIAELLVRLEEPANLEAVSAEEHRPNPTPSPPGKAAGELLSVSSSDPYSHRLLMLPRRASWTENTPREANEGGIEIAWRDLPLDPRSIRSAVLSIYAGAIRGEDFAAGVAQATEGPQGRRSYIARHRKNLRFVGHLDTSDLTASGKGDALQLKARDFTALLLDRDVPTATLRVLNPGQPLLEAVAEVVHSLPATQRLPVELDEDLAEEATIPLLAKTLRHVRGGSGKKSTKQGVAGAVSVKFWDLITDLCVLSGVVPVMELDRLRIRRPSTLFAGASTSRPALVWGGNLSRLKVSRRYGRLESRPVEVRCFDPATKKTNVARFPATPRATATPSGRGSSTEYHVRVLHGVDASALPAIAEGLYYEIASRPLELALETADVSSWGLDPAEADLLALRAGDPLDVLVRDLSSDRVVRLFRPVEIAEARQLGPAKLADELRRRGASPSVASALADALQRSDALSTFRVQRASHIFDAQAGYSAQIEASSFATIRLGGAR